MVTELSYWEKTVFFNYDIIVVGSGIVGLSAAIELKTSAPNLKVVILESGFLPSGASTKNAGFACFGSISELIEQEKICGTDGLVQLIENRWKGLLKLIQLLGESAIDYKPFGGYEIFKKCQATLANECVAKIEHFNQLISSIIGFGAFSLANDKINHFGFRGVETNIFNKYEAQIDSGKMMYHLLQYAHKLGITLLNNCKVEEIIPQHDGILLKTESGNFFCKKTVITTNAFVKNLIKNLDVRPGRGQVLVTKPIKNLRISGTFHYDKGYYYFRNIHDRLLLGGGRNLDFNTEETTELGLNLKIQNELESLLHEIILPDTNFEIDNRWSGIMAFGEKLKPIVEEVEPNVFCAVRGNGMGIAIGCQTGADVAKLLIDSI